MAKTYTYTEINDLLFALLASCDSELARDAIRTLQKALSRRAIDDYWAAVVRAEMSEDEPEQQEAS